MFHNCSSDHLILTGDVTVNVTWVRPDVTDNLDLDLVTVTEIEGRNEEAEMTEGQTNRQAKIWADRWTKRLTV